MEPRIFWSRIDWAARALLTTIVLSGVAYVWWSLLQDTADWKLNHGRGRTHVSLVILGVMVFGSIAVGIICWSREQLARDVPVPLLFPPSKFSLKVQRIVAGSYIASLALVILGDFLPKKWGISAEWLVAPFTFAIGMVGNVFGFTRLLLAFGGALLIVGIEQVLLYGSFFPELTRH